MKVLVREDEYPASKFAVGVMIAWLIPRVYLDWKRAVLLWKKTVQATSTSSTSTSSTTTFTPSDSMSMTTSTSSSNNNNNNNNTTALQQQQHQHHRQQLGTQVLDHAALMAIAIMTCILLLSSALVAIYTEGLDPNMFRILGGLSRIVSGGVLFFISLELPQWLGVYDYIQLIKSSVKTTTTTNTRKRTRRRRAQEGEEDEDKEVQDQERENKAKQRGKQRYLFHRKKSSSNNNGNDNTNGLEQQDGVENKRMGEAAVADSKSTATATTGNISTARQDAENPFISVASTTSHPYRHHQEGTAVAADDEENHQEQQEGDEQENLPPSSTFDMSVSTTEGDDNNNNNNYGSGQENNPNGIFSHHNNNQNDTERTISSSNNNTSSSGSNTTTTASTVPSMKAIKFDLQWRIMGQFARVYWVVLLFSCGGPSPVWGLPVNYMVGIVLGIALTWTVYFGRTKFTGTRRLQRDTFAYWVMAAMVIFSCTSFSFGCLFIQQVWRPSVRPLGNAMLFIAAFLTSLSLSLFTHVVAFRLSKKQLEERQLKRQLGKQVSERWFTAELFGLENSTRTVSFSAPPTTTTTSSSRDKNGKPLHVYEGYQEDEGEYLDDDENQHANNNDDDNDVDFEKGKTNQDGNENHNNNNKSNSDDDKDNQERILTKHEYYGSDDNNHHAFCRESMVCEDIPEEEPVDPATMTHYPEQLGLNWQGDTSFDEANYAYDRTGQPLQPESQEANQDDCNDRNCNQHHYNPNSSNNVYYDNDDYVDPTFCSLCLNKIKCCKCCCAPCGSTERGPFAQLNKFGRFVITLRWFFRVVGHGLCIYMVIVNIGATQQGNYAKKLFPTVDTILYKGQENGPVCAYLEPFEDDLTQTFANATEAYNAGYTIAHCGACGQCSTWQNLRLQWTTRRNLAILSRRCATKLLFGGYEKSLECHLETIGFDVPCSECWVEVEECAITYCSMIQMQAWIIANLGNFEVGPDVVTAAMCEEAICEVDFVPCSGANRRRMNIVSDIDRPSTQQCSTLVPESNDKWYKLFGPSDAFIGKK